MWGTFLSEPLRIVGLVGRCPANYLMRRMPIRDRGRPLRPARDAPHGRRSVLVGISPGYPYVTARLHTCYSPVRRSPAEESKLPSPLPLDLHVLSLSLAFILSQDQTLRCCIAFSFFSVRNRRGRAFCVTRLGSQELTSGFLLALVLLSIVYCNSFNVLVRVCLRSGVAEKPCKVTEKFSHRQIFQRKFSEKPPAGNQRVKFLDRALRRVPGSVSGVPAGLPSRKRVQS